MFNILLVLILALAVASGQLIRIPFGTGGITLLDITVFIFCLGGLIKSKFHLKRPSPVIQAALIFTSVAIISLLSTPLHLTTGEYVTSFSYIVRFFMYVLFAWLLYSDAFKTIKNNISKVFLFSGIAFAVLGILQFIIYPNLDFLGALGWDPHYYRTVSTFLDPNFAGAFLVLSILLIPSLRGATKRHHEVVSTLGVQSWLGFSLIYLALLTTFSRSSYLMFLISGLTLASLQKSIKILILTIVLFLILMGGFRVYTQAVAKPRNIDRTQSAYYRLNTWQQGLTIFARYPILGVGFNAYRYGIKQLNLGNDEFLQSHGASSNDSSLLFVASTTGLLGLAAYLYFLFTIFKNSWKKNKIVSVSLAGLIIHSFFANSLFYSPILAWILFNDAVAKK